MEPTEAHPSWVASMRGEYPPVCVVLVTHCNNQPPLVEANSNMEPTEAHPSWVASMCGEYPPVCVVLVTHCNNQPPLVSTE